MRERVDAEEVSQLIEGEGWWFGASLPNSSWWGRLVVWSLVWPTILMGHPNLRE